MVNHHNAVQITLDSEIAKSAEEAFLAMPHVAEISRHEVQHKKAALTRFTIYPREGQRLVDEIGAFARARGYEFTFENRQHPAHWVSPVVTERNTSSSRPASA